MALAAKLQFSQGASVGTPGEAFFATAGTAVTSSNADNSSVLSWTYQLTDVPVGSALSTAAPYSSGSSPTGSFTPDIPGSYQVLLTTTGVGGAQLIDVRTVIVKTANRGWALPAFQDTHLTMNYPNPTAVAPNTVGWKDALNKIFADFDANAFFTNVTSGATDGQFLSYVSASSKWLPTTTLRSPNNVVINQVRNAANNAYLQMLASDNSDQLYFGDLTGGVLRGAGGSNLYLYAGAAPRIGINGITGVATLVLSKFQTASQALFAFDGDSTLAEWDHNINGVTIMAIDANKVRTKKGRSRKTTPITAAYTILATDDLISVGMTATAITINLPATGLVDGDTYTVKDAAGGAATRNITVSGNGKNIDSGTTRVISTAYGSLDFTYNATLTLWMVT